MGGFIGLGLGLLALYGAHHWLSVREISAPPKMIMDAEVYPAGEGWVIRRQVQDPLASVVVMPGFLESPQYFLRYYDDPRIELIMVSNSGYHLPVQAEQFPPVPWSYRSQYPTGTIAADAELLNLALEHLPSSQNLRVHGHSRGAAVTLEAASQRPDLFSSVEVLLEAPALPQGEPFKMQPRAVQWLLPIVHLVWQSKPSILLSQPYWGSIEDPEKRQLIMNTPFNPRSSRLMLTNIRDLLNWMGERHTDIYRHVQRGAVLVPAKDRVLDSRTMLGSAQQAENLQIIEVADGNHFILWDNPEAIPPLIRNL